MTMNPTTEAQIELDARLDAWETNLLTSVTKE